VGGQGRQVAPVAEQTEVGRDDLDAAVAAVAQNGVEVLIDGGAEDGSTELLIVRGKVGAPSTKTNPNRTASDEHAVTSPEKAECRANRKRIEVRRRRFPRYCWPAYAGGS